MNMCWDTMLYASSLTTVLNLLSKKHLDTFIYMLPKIPSGKYINIKWNANLASVSSNLPTATLSHTSWLNWWFWLPSNLIFSHRLIHTSLSAKLLLTKGQICLSEEYQVVGMRLNMFCCYHTYLLLKVKVCIYFVIEKEHLWTTALNYHPGESSKSKILRTQE